MSVSAVGLPRRIAVVGLGYVGLPLAAAFAQRLPTLGFDINGRRIEELQQGRDRNGDVPSEALRSKNVSFTNEPQALQSADFIIVAVPTPVNQARHPDLSHLIEASQLVGQHLIKGATVVYESTVYPGCTEEVCLPILERESGLQAGRDFKIGYSPERINPGDKEHTLEKIIKVVAGQDQETTELMAQVYGLVVEVGIYKAPDIKTAEAAKVIENIQRDLNIALMNELAMLFHRLGLNTQEVLKAAQTKWNFLPFEPGLVGGHCIPIDPYYLTHKAQEIGYHPELILAGRRINDQMGLYVAHQTVKLLIRAGKSVKGSAVLVLGVTFKADVPDVRNSRVVDLVRELEAHGPDVACFDSLMDEVDVQRLGLRPVRDPFENEGAYDGVILAVPHKAFRTRPIESYVRLLRDGDKGVLVDVWGVFRKAASSLDRLIYWSL